jgi:cbb3-type cytochrome oxidase maturation protein
MEIIILIIGISLIIALTFLAIFIYSIKSGQFDDIKTPAIRILFDNKEVNNTNDTK